MVELDLTDRKLLFTLDCNARQSLSDIARKIRLGRDLVHYRLERLIRNGILLQCRAVVNPYKLGFTIYKTYLRLQSDTTRVHQLFKFVKEHPRAYWVAESHGQWDLIVSLFATSPAEFYAIQDQVLSRFSDIIIRFSVYTLVDVCMYKKSYLYEGKSEPIWIGGPPARYTLDPIEESILRFLSEDARQNITDIAERIGTTPTVVTYRIEKLEQLGIIVGYQVDLNSTKLGRTFFKLQIHLRDYRDEGERKLIDYCNAHPYITYLIKQIGECKFELEIEANGFEHYSEIIDELRQRFQKIILNIEGMSIRKQYFLWTPQDLVSAPEVKL